MPFHRNLPKRTIKAPKIYFTDTGLLSYLLKYPDWQSLSAGPQAGAIFENYIVTEVLKMKYHRNLRYEPYFYRDSNRNEIDLVIDKGFSTHLCEIKLAKTIGKKHYDTLRRLKEYFPYPTMSLVSLYPEHIPLDEGIENIPFTKLHEVIGV